MLEKNEINQTLGNPVDSWQSRPVPPQQTMTGIFCLLEPLSIKQHAEKLFDALCVHTPKESWAYLPYGPFTSFQEFKHWLNATLAEKDTQLYAILDNKSKQPLGICGYLRINPEHGSIEVGHLHYSTRLKRTPATTEAMYLMMNHALEDLKYRRYEWKCNSLNTPSCEAAKRLGFKFEGTFRQCNVFKGYNRDTAWFSIIDSEWPTLREKFKKWLNPGNFDNTGKQRVKLQEI